MTNRSQIILSQLTPPAQRANVLARERVNHILELSLNHALTILTAGTGYGKTTSILTFIQQRKEPVFWFSTSRNERDPRLFLSSLYTAFNQIGGPVTVSGSSSQNSVSQPCACSTIRRLICRTVFWHSPTRSVLSCADLLF